MEEKYVRSNRQLIQSGDILVSMSNSLELVGKCALVAQNPPFATFGTFIAVIRPRPGMEPRYVFNAMRTPAFKAHIRKTASTTTNISNINAAKLLSAPIPVFGGSTRQAIASKIDELFSRIDEGERALERVRKLVERYRQSVLKAAVTGELTREWREQHAGELESGEALLTRILEARRQAWEQSELAKMKAKGAIHATDTPRSNYKEAVGLDESDLFELPTGWVWTSLEQVSMRITDGTHQSPPFTTRGIPFLTIQHLSPNQISWDHISKWVSEETFMECTKSLRPASGDVLYSAVGSYGMAVALSDERNFMFQRHIAHIRPLSGVIEPRFLEAVLNAPFTLAHAHAVARGVAQKTVTLGHLREFAIPLPPISEQRVIADCLEIAESEIAAFCSRTSASFTSCSALKQAILKVAFSGQLVSQDPTDEPASVLLERIAAERAAAAPKSRAAKDGKSGFPSGMTTREKKAKA